MIKSNTITADLRPTDFEYACISKNAYNTGSDTLIKGREFETRYRKWFIMQTRDYESGYFGVILRCDQSKQFVIAHRGTNDLSDVFEDLKGIFLNKYSAQKEDAFQFVNYLVDLIRDKGSEYCNYSVSFTGHSLGGFLAEMCVFYAKTILYLEGTSAVSFDSPGTKQSMQALHTSLTSGSHRKPAEQLNSDWFRKLDITCYLSYPNAINACNDHVGSVYAVNVNVHGGMFASLPGIRLLNSHRMLGIVKWFENACIHNNPVNQRLHMADWPKGYKQLKIFYKNAVFKNKLYDVHQDLLVSDIPPPPVSTKENYICKHNVPSLHGSAPNLTHNPVACSEYDDWFKEQRRKINFKFYGNFKVLEISSFHILPLHHFSIPMQNFLKDFFQKRTSQSEEVRMLRRLGKPSKPNGSNHSFQSAWKKLGIPDDVSKSLESYEIRVNSIDIQEVVCGKEEESAYVFRQKISSWLTKVGYTVDDLFPTNFLHSLGSFRLINLYEKSPRNRTQVNHR